MSKIIIANWKMNPSDADEAKNLFVSSSTEAEKYSNLEVVICPPFVYIEELAKSPQGRIRLGSQDIFWEKSGPYTGEISVDMLKGLCVSHVLVGHSDRRYKMGESDEMINKKIKAALSAEIVPILLVGEKDKSDNRENIINAQLSANLDGISPDHISRILLTYEPVWAISTNPNAEPDTPENTLAAIEIISKHLVSKFGLSAEQLPKFLYGGSVNEKNIASFLSHSEIAGAVIGSASLKQQEFANVLNIVSSL